MHDVDLHTHTHMHTYNTHTPAHAHMQAYMHAITHTQPGHLNSQDGTGWGEVILVS
jgi:hypothetical protein